MPPGAFKVAIISLLTAAMVLLAFIAGYLVIHSGPAAPPVAADASAAGASGPSGQSLAPPAPPAPDIRLSWRLWDALENGCKVEQVGTQYHITGVTIKDGWNQFNGVTTKQEYPEGDFVASVDFKVPTFAGAGTPLVYLRVSSANNDHIGIFFRPNGSADANGYRIQSWTDPKKYSAWLGRIGDEATTYHRMKLQYAAATQTATGWIDDRLIGNVNAPLAGKLRFSLVSNTDRAGMSIDLYYDNFTLTQGGTTTQLAATPNGP